MSVTSRTDDILYCETCYGIPVSRYQIMHPDRLFRHCRALTRFLLGVHCGFNHEQIEEMLRPVFYCSTSMPCQGNAHQLHCGHVVWTSFVRPCGPNCNNNAAPEALVNTAKRQNDAILCRECLMRAEMVYKRYGYVLPTTEAEAIVAK
jgi:hypothetical protein